MVYRLFRKRQSIATPAQMWHKREGLCRPGPTENAHSAVLGLLYCPCSLCDVSLQGHQVKRAIKVAADCTLQILGLGPSFSSSQGISEATVRHTPTPNLCILLCSPRAHVSWDILFKKINESLQKVNLHLLSDEHDLF